MAAWRKNHSFFAGFSSWRFDCDVAVNCAFTLRVRAGELINLNQRDATTKIDVKINFSHRPVHVSRALSHFIIFCVCMIAATSVTEATAKSFRSVKTLSVCLSLLSCAVVKNCSSSFLLLKSLLEFCYESSINAHCHATVKFHDESKTICNVKEINSRREKKTHGVKANTEPARIHVTFSNICS